MKKFMVVILVFCSMGGIGCSNEVNENSISNKIELTSQVEGIREYSEDEFIKLLEGKENIINLSTNNNENIEKINNNNSYIYSLLDGEFSDYENLEKYILDTWNSIDDFNSMSNIEFFMNVDGKAYKCNSFEMKNVLKAIGLVSEINNDNGIISAEVAYISTFNEMDVSRDGTYHYSVINIKAKDNNGLKLISFEVIDTERDLYEDLIEFRNNRESLSEEEFEKSKARLIKIYESIDNNEKLKDIISDLNMTDEEYMQSKVEKESLMKLQGTYISEENSDDCEEEISLKIIDDNTIECLFSIDSKNYPYSSAINANRKLGELKKVNDNLWSGRLENGGFIREWEVEIEINDGYLIYTEKSINCIEFNDDTTSMELDESKKNIYENPDRVRFNKK